MADKKNQKFENIEKLTFEQAIALLQEIVEKVETGQIGLEDAIGQYETGCRLVQHCKQILEGAERKIEILSKGLDGQLAAQPLKGQVDQDAEDEEDDK
jgi:exodeoxyribonuclease VII small subunit